MRHRPWGETSDASGEAYTFVTHLQPAHLQIPVAFVHDFSSPEIALTPIA
jgi:hypothetical protein